MAKILVIDGKPVVEEGAVFTDESGVDCCCEEATGACCLPSKCCQDGFTEADCVAQGGIYLGDGSICLPEPIAAPPDRGPRIQPGADPCPPEACCYPDGTCVDVNPCACLGSGGIPQGAGTTCAEVSCPSDVVGCCFPCLGGFCKNLPPEECAVQGGDILPDLCENVDPALCPPTGCEICALCNCTPSCTAFFPTTNVFVIGPNDTCISPACTADLSIEPQGCLTCGTGNAYFVGDQCDIGSCDAAVGSVFWSVIISVTCLADGRWQALLRIDMQQPYATLVNITVEQPSPSVCSSGAYDFVSADADGAFFVTVDMQGAFVIQ